MQAHENSPSGAQSDISLYCDETLDTALILSKAFSLHEDSYDFPAASSQSAPKEENSDEVSFGRCTTKPLSRPKAGSRMRKSYIAYTNKDKIDFFLLAGKIGYKKAAAHGGICWSTAKAWVKKDEALRSIQKSYIDILQSQGDKKKVGVGRKVSYGQEIEDEILWFAMKLRESEDGVSMSSLKKKAMEFMTGKCESFKASDGWYKKFCIRNCLNMREKFEMPKKIPGKGKEKMEEFKRTFRKSIKEVPKNKVAFVDKVELDLSKFTGNISKGRHGKIATVLLTITFDGTILKPFVMLPDGISVQEFPGNDLIAWASTKTGSPDEATLCQWFEKSLSCFNLSTIFSQEYRFFSQAEFSKILDKARIAHFTFPQGLNCALNPFRKITPLFVSAMNVPDKSLDPDKEIKGEVLLCWIIMVIDSLISEHRDVLVTAFDCFENF